MKNLETLNYSKNESFISNIKGQTLRAILNYKNHSNIIVIQKIEMFFTSENSKKGKLKKNP